MIQYDIITYYNIIYDNMIWHDISYTILYYIIFIFIFIFILYYIILYYIPCGGVRVDQRGFLVRDPDGRGHERLRAGLHNTIINMNMNMIYDFTIIELFLLLILLLLLLLPLCTSAYIPVFAADLHYTSLPQCQGSAKPASTRDLSTKTSLRGLRSSLDM